MFDLLALVPWAATLVFIPALFRRRPRLTQYPPPAAAESPRVSIIVPARNEAGNIGACIRSLLTSTYPDFEIIVVDDRSEDGTGEILDAMAEQGIEKLTVVAGEELPAGWFGKPWACWQGARRARGELLLFTDADTRHDPALLGHAVGALRAEGVDLVTAVAYQELGSFWERIVMPQFLVAILMRYGSLKRVNRSRDPLDVIANGQFILIRRDAYDEIGGHESVRGEVVEDLRLAQRTVEAGRRLLLAFGEDLLQTRMYDSLPGIVEGWSKNVATGSRQTVRRWLRPLLPYLVAAYLLLMWVVPPVTLVAALVLGRDGDLRGWGAGAVGLSLLFWTAAYTRLRTVRAYALFYPLGALVSACIFLRSAWLGPRVQWKGRRYGGRVGA